MSGDICYVVRSWLFDNPLACSFGFHETRKTGIESAESCYLSLGSFEEQPVEARVGIEGLVSALSAAEGFVFKTPVTTSDCTTTPQLNHHSRVWGLLGDR
jgi:hypothetical protein